MNEALQAVIRRTQAELELRLITRIEEIEGRVPSNAEVATHGAVIVSNQKSETTFCWKGRPIVGLRIDGSGIAILEPK